MMNRVFDPETTIDVGGEAGEAPAPQPHHPTPAPADRSGRSSNKTLTGSTNKAGTPAAETGTNRRHDQTLLLVCALAGVCLVSAASSILYVSHWNRLQQSLSQERNLLLVERLRDLGPAVATPLAPAVPATPNLPQPSLAPAASGTAMEGLPPPPPEEPWIQQLPSLPGSGLPGSGLSGSDLSGSGLSSSGRRSPGLLRVPVSPQVLAAAPQAQPAAPAPPRRATANPSAPLPQLVGVVGTPGKAASAIFLVSGTSMSVGSGESIGSSGWRLRSADGETALIERGGEVRQVSIVNGF
jgi:hypothetical protein